MDTWLITKASGKQEPFNLEKFKRSLARAHVPADLAVQLSHEIVKQTNLKTTQDIYEYAFKRLRQEHRPVAARYHLKSALLQLGPDGFAFEKLVGHLLRKQGYIIDLNQIMPGWCVNHEVDIIAHQGNQHYLVEVKFHNEPGLKSNVKIPLYVKARFDDIFKRWQADPAHTSHINQTMLVTNTSFTADALEYGLCSGITLLGWDYPHGTSLAQLIDKHSLYPLTTLTTLKQHHKRVLIEQDILLCQEIVDTPTLLDQLHLTQLIRQQVLDEAQKMVEK